MELKKTISRSFTRKVNLGNYESADFWAMYSEEISADEKEHQMLSDYLYACAKSDVEQAIKDYKNSNKTEEDIINEEIQIKPKGKYKKIVSSIKQDESNQFDLELQGEMADVPNM